MVILNVWASIFLDTPIIFMISFYFSGSHLRNTQISNYNVLSIGTYTGIFLTTTCLLEFALICHTGLRASYPFEIILYIGFSLLYLFYDMHTHVQFPIVINTFFGIFQTDQYQYNCHFCTSVHSVCWICLPFKTKSKQFNIHVCLYTNIRSFVLCSIFEFILDTYLFYFFENSFNFDTIFSFSRLL